MQFRRVSYEIEHGMYLYMSKTCVISSLGELTRKFGIASTYHTNTYKVIKLSWCVCGEDTEFCRIFSLFSRKVLEIPAYKEKLFDFSLETSRGGVDKKLLEYLYKDKTAQELCKILTYPVSNVNR